MSSRPSKSAGILLFRRKNDRIEVLLGHMGGPYFARREEGAWSIPKGLIEEGEEPLEAAIREFQEEIGPLPSGTPMPLPEIRQQSDKRVLSWALEGDFDVADHRSNDFNLEWPPKSGRMQRFPELDRVEWMPIERACTVAVKGQAELFRALERLLNGSA